MEQFGIQDQAIKLGKYLVSELELEDGVDTLSKWMTHYIAEQITIAENSEGEKKEEAKQKCFETILKLWERRIYFPEGKRPLEEFDPIFRVLERLDTEKDHLPFYKLKDFDEVKNTSEKKTDFDTWINHIENIDKVAKQLIRFCLVNAYESSKDEKTQEWITNSIESVDGMDIQAARVIVRMYEDQIEEESEEEFEVKILTSLLEEIDLLEKTQNEIRDYINNRINRVK